MNIKQIKSYIFLNFDKVKINSKDIVKGDIFIALPGRKNHGSKYIKQAINKKAKFIITDTVLDNSRDNIFVVKNVLKFLLIIAKQKRKLFSGKVIGITGSVGKTSVKENLKFFLEDSFNVSASIKSYNNYLGLILSILNLNLNSEYGIFEIGTNDFFEIKKLTVILKPSQVVITNIYPTHLEKLISTKNIAKEKSDIFNPKFNSNTELVILSNGNKDEKNIIITAKKLKLFKVLTIGLTKDSEIQIIKIQKYDKSNSEVFLRFNKKKINIIINNNQLTRINNILICLCIFIYNKISLEIFNSLSQKLPLIEGRGLLRLIKINNKKVKLIDESYNASPQSMKITIDYFTNLKISKNKKKFLILGDMMELGKETINYHKELLSYINSKNLKNIILCGESMKLALGKNHNKNMILKLNKVSIFNYLKKNVNSNDIILIKGSNSSITNDVASMLLKKRKN